MQRLRDNPQCADTEYASISNTSDPGLSYNLTFNPTANIIPFTTSLSNRWSRPRVAILREQGVNGHAEMAFAFDAAGFSAVDVHMTDILSDRVSLVDFKGNAFMFGWELETEHYQVLQHVAVSVLVIPSEPAKGGRNLSSSILRLVHNSPNSLRGRILSPWVCASHIPILDII